ncbi:hypothetical protein ACWDTB_31765, partial [Streptomyces sp. NPDC003487]
QDTDRDVDEEHPPPVQPFGEHAARQQADRAATITTTNISTSTAAMIRLRVFGSTASSLAGHAE